MYEGDGVISLLENMEVPAFGSGRVCCKIYMNRNSLYQVSFSYLSITGIPSRKQPYVQLIDKMNLGDIRWKIT